MITPEYILLGTVVLCLFASILAGFKRESANLITLISVIGCLAAIIVLAPTLKSESTYLFNNSILIDGVSQFIKLILLLTCIISVTLSWFSNEVLTAEKSDLMVLFLISTIAMCLVSSTNNLLMMMIGLLISGNGYIFMTGVKRNSKESIEAATKMFLFETFIFCLFCCGVIILYSFTKTLNVQEIREYFTSKNIQNPILLSICFAFLFASALTRLFIFPFHFLAPDMIQGSPIPVAVFYSISSICLGTSLILRICFQTFGIKTSDGEWTNLAFIDWRTLLGAISIGTISIGNIIALSQKNLKRMLGFFCIAQSGIILMSLSVSKQSGISAELFSLLSYSISILGIFYVLQIVSDSKENDFVRIKGLIWKMPYVAVAFILFLLSLSGVPPLLGFISRFYVLGEIIKEKHYVLAALTLINWIIGLGYTLFIIRLLFASGDLKETDLKEKQKSRYFTKLVSRVALLILIMPTVVFGIYWDFLMSYIHEAINRVLW